jgi:UDP-galactopyranose mutase
MTREQMKKTNSQNISLPRALASLDCSPEKFSYIAPDEHGPDLICFSHLRWDFVYQRPQHLMARCARQRRVVYWEEPVLASSGKEGLVLSQRQENLTIATPHVSSDWSPDEVDNAQREMLDCLLIEQNMEKHVRWYYTPMALKFSDHLPSCATVYDCMDELSAFKGASPLLRVMENNLFRQADLVFTGGQSLYEAKRPQHHSVYAFPSSIDARHFGRARQAVQDPEDQAGIPRPRMGFFGVLDERLDLELLRGIATARPDWQFVMIGPVVKIDAEELPQAANIHYLGSKPYDQLPSYLAGWDVALILFAKNESTRFISPTKTPEYLAAGKPVVSTSIHDVVHPYGEAGLVRIADSPADFVAAIGESLQAAPENWIQSVDRFLSGNSWDSTWSRMWKLVTEKLESQRPALEKDELQLETTSSDPRGMNV